MTASDIFDKHSINAVGHVGASKPWVLPAMEEYAELRIQQYLIDSGILDTSTGELNVPKKEEQKEEKEQEFLMPFGKHKGKKMSEVPDSYLLWLSDEGTTTGLLRAYIDDNIQAIRNNTRNKKIEDDLPF